MTRIEQLANDVRQLTPAELMQFRHWFQEWDAAEWDRQIAEDAAQGRLDDIAARALAEHRAGNSH